MSINAIERGSVMWNLWHGCHKLSAGCQHCYVYRGDAKRDIDSSVVTQTKSFDLPIRRKKNGEYKVPSGTLVYTCFTSDFFVADADEWRAAAWRMIRERSDLRFLIITKRIDRFNDSLPDDWGDGYDNVTICCTVENQAMADYRLPIYEKSPIKHKMIICEPLLGKIDLSSYHIGTWIEQVVAGGESGAEARPCDFEWVMSLHDECATQGVSFWFKQTGAKFIKEGRLYKVPRQLQHTQARKADINLKTTFEEISFGQKKELSEMTLKDLWQLFPIILTPHNPNWKEWYNDESAELHKILKDKGVARISHIGSTAINGIWAKPIVDILIEMIDRESLYSSCDELLKNGYLCMCRSDERLDLNKGYTKTGFAERVFHIHIRLSGDNDELYFRDYLNENHHVAMEYESLKKSLWKRFEHDRDAYTDAKTEFVRKYTLEAKRKLLSVVEMC